MLLIPSEAVDSTNPRAIRWLRGQLPQLVSSGVISAESAAAIDHHYEAAEARSGNFAFVILAAIGSALVGAGIILLVAHNWDELSRPTRCIIAFLPLVLAQALGFFALQRRSDSPAWRESVAILDVAAVGTAIALVSQTFQIQGSFADFLRVWLLLSIPIVYLFRSNFAALAYMIGAAIWVLTKVGWQMQRPGLTFFWVLLLLVLPFYVRIIRERRTGWVFGILSLALVGAGVTGLGATVDFSDAHVGGVAFAGFFTVVYLIGMMWDEEAERTLNVMAVLGGIGIAATAVTLSFEDMWTTSTASASAMNVEQCMAIGIALAFPVAAIALATWTLIRGRIAYSMTAAAMPIVAAIARVMAGLTSHAFAASLLFDVYTLALGIELLVRGIRADSVTRANFGLLVIAALALARFFDSDLSFVVRGVGFIMVGAAFLVANLLFFRRHAKA